MQGVEFLAARQVVADWVQWVVVAGSYLNLGVMLWERGKVETDRSQYWLYASACWLVLGLIDLVNGDLKDVWLNAALMAWDLILWWRNGGGGRTKRRLRSPKEKFKPVRRTAPAATGA